MAVVSLVPIRDLPFLEIAIMLIDSMEKGREGPLVAAQGMKLRQLVLPIAAPSNAGDHQRFQRELRALRCWA